MCDSNESAGKQLWDQVFNRLAKDDYASIVDPNHDPSEEIARSNAALLKAGWTQEQISLRHQVESSLVAAAPVTSPGVSPYAEAFLSTLGDEVEAAMGRLGLVSQAKVSRGVEPRLGPFASKINVVMTDESIVTVGSHTFRFCGLVARAFTRTLHQDPSFWEHDVYDQHAGREKLRSSPAVMAYWQKIFLSYALTGTNLMTPFWPSGPFEAGIVEQVARAMELFVIAHEYGHHHHIHGKTLGEDAQAEEFEADQFALKVCYEIERHSTAFENPYLSSGAGGVVLLSALKTLRGCDMLLGDMSTPVGDTHPDAQDRIARFNTVAVMRPREFRMLWNFRRACERIMVAVGQEVLDVLAKVPEADRRRAKPARFETV